MKFYSVTLKVTVKVMSSAIVYLGLLDVCICVYFTYVSVGRRGGTQTSLHYFSS